MSIFSRKNKKLRRSESIVFGREGNEPIKEAYVRLKDNILCFAVDGKKVIQVESSTASEGKTTVVSNLSVCLGASGKKVIVLDMDFRKARLHRSFELENKDGIIDYMVGKVTKDQMIKKTKYENVSIINRGSEVTNASVILTSGKLQKLVDELKEEYDFVILDCPPVLLISDYIHISRLADGVLFVVAYGQTKKKQVAEAIHQMTNNNMNIIGAVFSFYDYKKSNSYSEYNYGYYNYYGYGEKKKK